MLHRRTTALAAWVLSSLLAAPGPGPHPERQIWFGPRTASACGNAVFEVLTKQAAIEMIKKSEELLASGEYEKAYAEIHRVVGEEEHEGEIGVKGNDEKLQNRLYELYAMALVHCGQDSEAKELLDKLVTARPKDPFLQARSAELLSLNPTHWAEARKQLEKLAKKDLLVDATGFATLARLRGQAGDSAGQQQAIERCRQMAKAPALCDRVPMSGAVREAARNWMDQMLAADPNVPTPVYAADFKAVLHDASGGVRNLDLAGWKKESTHRPRAVENPHLTETKYGRAAEQPKRGEVWELRCTLRFEPTSRHLRKAGQFTQVEKLIRLRNSDDKYVIFYEEQFGPLSIQTRAPAAAPTAPAASPPPPATPAAAPAVPGAAK